MQHLESIERLGDSSLSVLLRQFLHSRASDLRLCGTTCSDQGKWLGAGEIPGGDGKNHQYMHKSRLRIFQSAKRVQCDVRATIMVCNRDQSKEKVVLRFFRWTYNKTRRWFGLDERIINGF